MKLLLFVSVIWTKFDPLTLSDCLKKNSNMTKEVFEKINFLSKISDSSTKKLGKEWKKWVCTMTTTCPQYFQSLRQYNWGVVENLHANIEIQERYLPWTTGDAADGLKVVPLNRSSSSSPSNKPPPPPPLLGLGFVSVSSCFWWFLVRLVVMSLVKRNRKRRKSYYIQWMEIPPTQEN